SIRLCATPISNKVEGGTPQGADGAIRIAAAISRRAASICARRPPSECPISTGGDRITGGAKARRKIIPCPGPAEAAVNQDDGRLLILHAGIARCRKAAIT